MRLLLCATGDGRNVFSVTVFDIWARGSHSVAFRNLTPPAATASPLQYGRLGLRPAPRSAGKTTKCNVNAASLGEKMPSGVQSGVRKVLAYADAPSARPVCSSRSWLKWQLEHNKNRVVVMWPFRQSSRRYDVRMLAATRGLVTAFEFASHTFHTFYICDFCT